MIRLLELYPDHLNLNGDSGNLQVLERRLEWAGQAVERLSYRPGDSIGELIPDFVLLGHGSRAAWRQIYGDLVQIAPTLQGWIDSSVQVLAVSSGFAALHGLIRGLPVEVQKVPRVSKFETADYASGQVVGYKNTDLELPTIARHGNLVGTVLHGPVLAKNPNLTNEFIELMAIDGLAGGYQLNESVALFVEDARNLAIELSSE